MYIWKVVYTATHNPLKSGRAKTEAYVDNGSMLGARFCAKVLQADVGTLMRRIQRAFRVWEFITHIFVRKMRF